MTLVVHTVVQYADRVLLVEEAKALAAGTWNLPGGAVELGESLQAAAVRETREEAGVDVVLQGLALIHHGWRANTPSSLVTHFVFLGELPEPASQRLKSWPDEHSLRAAWFAVEALSHLPLRDSVLLEWIAAARNAPTLLPLSELRVRF